MVLCPPHAQTLHSRFCGRSHLCLSPRTMVPRHPAALRKWVRREQSRELHPPHTCTAGGLSHQSILQKRWGPHVQVLAKVLRSPSPRKYFISNSQAPLGDTCWPNLASAPAGPVGSRRSRDGLSFEKKGKEVWHEPVSVSRADLTSAGVAEKQPLKGPWTEVSWRGTGC